jgi:hypothetical protein
MKFIWQYKPVASSVNEISNLRNNKLVQIAISNKNVLLFECALVDA